MWVVARAGKGPRSLKDLQRSGVRFDDVAAGGRLETFDLSVSAFQHFSILIDGEKRISAWTAILPLDAVGYFINLPSQFVSLVLYPGRLVYYSGCLHQIGNILRS